MSTVGAPSTTTPPCAVLLVRRAAGLPLISTVGEPITTTSGGPTHTHMLPIVAAGSIATSTVGAPGDTVVCRGNPDSGEFIAFWTADGRVTAGMNVNVWDVTDPIQQLIRSRRQVSAERLADPAVPLEDLVA